ncbi:MAG: DNA-binding protein WhiA, partial [Halanaerobiales bacterium]
MLKSLYVNMGKYIINGMSECMSFTDKVKNEIVRETGVRKCCQLAEMSALIKVEGSLEIVNNELALKMVSQRAVVARELYKLLKEKYNYYTNIKVGKRNNFNKENYYIIELPPQAEIKELLIDCGLIDDNYNISYEIKDEFLNNNCCRSSYLRGLFLAAGMVAHPKSEYHMEFFIKYAEYAEELIDFFDIFSIDIKKRQRNQHSSLYIKKADDII